MKKAYYHLLFAAFVALSGCSQREAAPSERSYFIGSWKLNARVVTDPNAVQTVLTFHDAGALTLNVQVEGLPQPDRRWAFDDNADQLQFFLPEQESYLLFEKTADQFKAKNTVNNSILLFTRQK